MILYSGYFGYLCLVLRKKLGDWLLDIAKYIASSICEFSKLSVMWVMWPNKGMAYSIATAKTRKKHLQFIASASFLANFKSSGSQD